MTKSEETIIKKVFEISGKNASLALSKTLHLDLDKYEVWFGETAAAPQENGCEKAFVTFLDFDGAVAGKIIIALPEKDTVKIVNEKLLQNMGGADLNLTMSAVSEIANIIVGAFFSTLSDFCKVNVLESTPKTDIKNWQELGSIARDQETMTLAITLKTHPEYIGYFILSMKESASKTLVDILKINRWKELSKTAG